MSDDEQRKGREGSRWINERPAAEEVASWFKDNVALHDNMEHEDYVSGITLISSTDKNKQVIGFRENGSAIIEERPFLVYTPYPRVDIRIKYFHDLMALHEDEWYGVIEPVLTETPQGVYLPDGFFSYSVPQGEKKVNFVCCRMKVTVYERKSFEVKEVVNRRTGETSLVTVGNKVLDAPPATKMIQAARNYADEFALMKAETGAIGRALGMAGMLVVPGAGVATAEDMGEVNAPPPQADAEDIGAGGEEPAPSEGKQPTDEELRDQAASLVKQLKDEYPGKWAEFQAWSKERGIGKLADTVSPALRGVVRQLERKLSEGRAEAGNETAESKQAD